MTDDGALRSLGDFTATTNIVALRPQTSVREARDMIHASSRERRRQRLYPVVDDQQQLVGVATRNMLEHWIREQPDDAHISEIVQPNPAVAYPDEPLRVVVYRMAEMGITRFPVIERGPMRRVVGMISLTDLLQARTQNLEAERRRERVLSLRLAFPARRTRRADDAA